LAKVRIVTDSAAQFEDPGFVEDYGINVAPLSIHFGAQSLQDGIDITSEDMFQRLRHSAVMPTVQPPSVETFAALFEELSRTTDQICALLHSQHLTRTYEHAQMARTALMGRCEIAVIDSLTASAGLGFLVQAAAEAAARGASLEEVVRIARAVVPRLYCVYYVETLDYVQRAKLIGPTQAILGAMLGIKPFLTIEDGMLITMEKVRTHTQAVDKMVEFVAEFTEIARLVILQNTLRITERTRMLQDRLALEFPDMDCPVMLYEPLIATHIGPDGMGVVVYEGTAE
jgi:DegV family protein with EDD domain